MLFDSHNVTVRTLVFQVQKVTDGNERYSAFFGAGGPPFARDSCILPKRCAPGERRCRNCHSIPHCQEPQVDADPPNSTQLSLSLRTREFGKPLNACIGSRPRSNLPCCVSKRDASQGFVVTHTLQLHFDGLNTCLSRGTAQA